MKVTLNSLLSEYKPSHTIEETMLISRFSCGCIVTLTIGGRPKGTTPKRHFWHDKGNCQHPHNITDLDYMDTIATEIGPKHIATEIKMANSVNVSISIYEEKK